MTETAPLQAVEHRELLQALKSAQESIQSLTPGEAMDAAAQAEVLQRAHMKALYAANRLAELWIAARFDAGEFKPEPRPVALDDLINRAIQDLRPKARALGVDLSSKVEGAPPVLGSDHLLASLVANLLSSAIGVSKPGTSLILSLFERDSEVLLKFEDQGQVISSKLFPTLATGKAVDGDEGNDEKRAADIGMLTTKPIVEAHDGRLWVERQGEGSTALFISLPPAAERPVAKGTGTVLIVDDDPDTTFMLEQAVAKGGYDTIVAYDGLSGFTQAKQERPDLVLLDVMLPGIDGFEVCHRLRKDPATSAIPVVLMSAKGRSEDIAMGMRMGANEYLVKPLRLAEVLEKVALLIGAGEE